MARIKNAYINDIMKVKNELNELRMIQVALITLEDHINDYTSKIDYFFYKEYQGLIKRSIKICDYIILKFGGYKVYKNKKELDIAVDVFNTVLLSIQAEKTLDIDKCTGEGKEVIEDIKAEHKLAVHMYYFLELIAIYNKKIKDVEIQNLVKGFLMTAKGINNKILNELRSDKIFKWELK